MMSALAWLFGLGALTVAFPFLFHLIRRTPKGQTEFSSLMFLKPSPPTLTRRSRLENILLLLMRALAILLIAIAFMRPFFRGTDTLSEVDVANRRIAILLDTSASMQRSNLWDQARQKVTNVLRDLEPGDDVSLLAFDRTLRPVVDFATGTETGKRDRARLIQEGLDTLNPTSFRSDLGQALVSVADRLDIWRDSQRAANAKTDSKLQIVVVSDLQKGSKIESLQSYQWPAQVYVKFLTVVPSDYSNATVQLLDSVAEDDDLSLRVRVVNSEDSKLEQFSVKWSGENEDQLDDPIAFYVPPGTSRVLRVAPEASVAASQFVVSGDPEDFDNTYFVVPIQQQKLSIAYVGSGDPDDAGQPQFYLRRALMDTPGRMVTVSHVRGSEDWSRAGFAIQPPTLAVVTLPLDERQRNEFDSYLESGGTALFVLMDDEMTANTTAWTSASVSVDSVNENGDSRTDYLMLAEVDFASPLFQPFANPRYNDFTQIRFWRHRRVDLDEEGINVIARFDNEEPAIWQRALPSGGNVFVFASGWQPKDSQLALSSKFVPLINGLLEMAANLPELNKSLLVGDPIIFPPAAEPVTKRLMIKPDGSQEVIDKEQVRYLGVDQPGIYRLKSSLDSDLANPNKAVNVSETNTETAGKNEFAFAVNIDRAESETAVIPVEQLEMLNVKVGQQTTASVELAQLRELRDRDIENRQKVWKWLIVTAILLLIAETWLAGRTASRMLTGPSESLPQPAGRPIGDMI
jgi:hypothetical protein